MNLLKANSPNPRLRVHLPDPARPLRSLCGVHATAWQTDLADPNCQRCAQIRAGLRKLLPPRSIRSSLIFSASN